MARSKKKGKSKAKAPAGLSPVAALGPTLRQLMAQAGSGEVDAEALRDRLDASLRGIAPEKALPILLSTAVKAGPEAMARLDMVMPGRMVEAGEAETLAGLLGSGRLDPDAVDLGRRWLEGSGVDLSVIPDAAALRAPRLAHARILKDDTGSQGLILLAWHPPGEQRRLHISMMLLDYIPPWEGSVKEVHILLDQMPRMWEQFDSYWKRAWGSRLVVADAAEVKAAVLEALAASRAANLRLPEALRLERDRFVALMDTLPDPPEGPGFSAEDFDALASLERTPEQLGAHERRYGRKVRGSDGRKYRVINVANYDPDIDYEADLEEDEELLVTSEDPDEADAVLASRQAQEILDSFDGDDARQATPEEIELVREARRAARDAWYELQRQVILEPLGQGRPDSERVLSQHGQHLIYVRHHEPRRTGNFLGEHIRAYRRYRADFARFGDQRELLDFADFDSKLHQYQAHRMPEVIQKIRELWDTVPGGLDEELDTNQRALLAKAEAEASPEELERLRDLLMMEHWLVQDILPPTPPPEPAGWSAPLPRQYEGPAASLLEIGPVLQPAGLEAFADDPVWQDAEARRDLVRMATDPGLLCAWPAKPESWAPYHAMSMLGVLDAHELVEGLRPIIDPTDWEDWYGDHLLSNCLSMMGPEVEPFTWSLIRDPELDVELRGLVLLGLIDRVELMPERADEIAEQIADFMQADDPDDPDRKTANAFAAFVLAEDCFPEEIAVPAIQKADEAGLIDHEHYDPQDSLDFDPRDL